MNASDALEQTMLSANDIAWLNAIMELAGHIARDTQFIFDFAATVAYVKSCNDDYPGVLDVVSDMAAFRKGKSAFETAQFMALMHADIAGEPLPHTTKAAAWLLGRIREVTRSEGDDKIVS